MTTPTPASVFPAGVPAELPPPPPPPPDLDPSPATSGDPGEPLWRRTPRRAGPSHADIRSHALASAARIYAARAASTGRPVDVDRVLAAARRFERYIATGRLTDAAAEGEQDGAR